MKATYILSCHLQTGERSNGLMQGFLVLVRKTDLGRDARYMWGDTVGGKTVLFGLGWPEHGDVGKPCILGDDRAHKHLEPDQVLAQTGAEFKYVFLGRAVV